MTESRVPRFEDFDVSENTGFVLENPDNELPEYFAPWKALVEELVELIESKQLRQRVNEMPLLDHTKLAGYKQLRLAHLYLTHIGISYVWQDGPAGVVKSVPRQLAIPWCAISELVELPPILTLQTVLSNYRILDTHRPLDMSNMKVLSMLPGDEACRQLFYHTIQVELDALPGLKAIVRGMQGVVEGNVESVTVALQAIIESLETMMTSMKSIQKLMNPDVFFNVLSPFLGGWGGEGSPLSDGLIYEGVSDIPRQLKNGNQAQSSSMQCFDAALGIIHGSDTLPYLENLRRYMPPKHAQFITAIRNGPSIKEFVDRNDNEALRNAFSAAILTLKQLRTNHIALTARFIIQQMKKGEGAGMGPPGFVPILKSIRDTTATPPPSDAAKV